MVVCASIFLWMEFFWAGLLIGSLVVVCLKFPSPSSSGGAGRGRFVGRE